jgi:hypothetical protein
VADESGESRPTPDPTVLTTEQLLREIENLKSWMKTLADGQETVFDERFKSVDTQFKLIERQRVEQKQDTEKAVQAALNAAKVAVREQTQASERSIAKNEKSTADQLRDQRDRFASEIGNVDKNADDLKERVGKIENLRLGAGEMQQQGRASQAAFLGWVVAGVSVVGLIVVLVNTLTSK